MKESKLSDTREKVVSRSGKRNRAPEERSSKIPLSRAGQAIPPNKLGPARRDPRFERSSGQFNQGLFEKSYGFVYDYEDEELLYLDKQIKQTSDPDLAASIKSRARSLRDRIASRKSKHRRREICREWKRSERNLVKQGKTPFYLKKSDIKNLELVEKYKDLSTRGSTVVRRYIESKNRKRASSSKKYMPAVPSPT